MAGASKIEWTESTWNPIVGCSIKSPGCARCYAMRMAWRLSNNPATPHYAGTAKMTKAGPVFTGKVVQASEETLLQPLHWKKPRRIFVNSMGDLFHESIPDEWIDRVFAVMALCPQHTFQVLTKRADRMREYLTRVRTEGAGTVHDLRRVISLRQHLLNLVRRDKALNRKWLAVCPPDFPLPNVWLGVSTERQQEADERIPLLLQTPAAVRFISAEPLLGPLDLSRFMWPVCGWWRSPHRSYAEAKAAGGECGLKRQALVSADSTFLDWVIVGGESGPNARPMHPDWARDIRNQCAAAGVPFFYKQWGEFEQIRGDPLLHDKALRGHGLQIVTFDDGVRMGAVGKKAAGRLLDGREHNEFPVTQAKANA